MGFDLKGLLTTGLECLLTDTLGQHSLFFHTSSLHPWSLGAAALKVEDNNTVTAEVARHWYKGDDLNCAFQSSSSTQKSTSSGQLEGLQANFNMNMFPPL